MIHQVLSVIAQELQQDFQHRFSNGGRAHTVLLSNLSNRTDTATELKKDSMILTLINVQEEKITPQLRPGGGIKTNPPVFLNLTVLFSANFKDYVTSLSFLSATIGCFQAKYIFTPQNTPGISGFANRISAEIVNYDSRELSSIWAMLGKKYRPSVVYKFKVIQIEERNILQEIPSIKSIQEDDIVL